MIVNLSKVSCKYRNNNKNMWPDSRKHSKFGYLFQKLISIGVLLQIIGICGLCNGAIKSVNMIVDPIAVRRGQSATVRCLYDLDNAPLYSVKFYRGAREIYRFSPTEIPNKKVFPFPGINVDSSRSNSSQVVIRNVSFGLSGNFSCEVTCDAPSFSTRTAYVQMQVVELPDAKPTLWTESDRYEPGDVLRANCSSPPSKPKADLTLTVNNVVIYAAEPQYFPTIEGLIASRISMRLQLQSIHFGMPNYGGSIMNGGGQLVLRCTAQIGSFYQEYAEVELGVPQKDPIPARVTSSNANTNPPDLMSCIIFTAFSIFSMFIRQHVR